MAGVVLDEFLKQRNLLLNAGSYEEAKTNFRWPPPGEFNWAVDYFDKYLAETATNPALVYINDELFKTSDSRIFSYPPELRLGPTGWPTHLLSWVLAVGGMSLW